MLAAQLGVLKPSVEQELDPYWEYVILLLHTDELSVSDALIDSSSQNQTIGHSGPGVVLDTVTPLYGEGSLQLDGNYYVGTDGDPQEDWYYPAGVDFTIELSFKQDESVSTVQGLICNQAPSGTWNGVQFVVNGGNSGVQAVLYGANLAVANCVALGVAPVGVKHTVSFSRQGEDFYLHVDGVMVSSATSSGGMQDPENVEPMFIGTDPSNTPARNFVGLIDEVRITRGVGRYGSDNYTVRTTPFPNG